MNFYLEKQTSKRRNSQMFQMVNRSFNPTHAISKKILFKNLIIVIDEQHKFGVKQSDLAKKLVMIVVLLMSATYQERGDVSLWYMDVSKRCNAKEKNINFE